MIKIFTVFFLFYQLVLPGRVQDDKVLASVGSHKILFSQFTERYIDYLIAAGLEDNLTIRQAILNNMVNEVLLRYYDDNSSILNNPEYQKEISWKEKQVLLAFLKDQEIHARITVTDEELRETFTRVNETISTSHLYTTSEEEAWQIYEMLNIGVDWDNLAAQLFADSLLRSTGGYLGFFTWGDMDPAFEDAAYSLKPGEYSKPVKTAYGYSIVRLDERKPHPLLTEWQYNLKKPKLSSLLRLRKKKPAEKEYTNSILEKYPLNFDPAALNALFSYFSFSLGMNEKPDKFVDGKPLSFAGKEYSSEEIISMVEDIPAYKREKIAGVESFKNVISGLILQDYLIRKAVEKKYDTVSYVKERMDLEWMQVFLKYKQREILDAANVTEEEMRDFFNNNLQYFTLPAEYNLQEIIVSNLSAADSLKYIITQGKDFGTLARESSERLWSAENNGETGYIPESGLGFMKDIVIKAEIGELIGPVRIEDKFGLFRIVGKKDGEIKSFESVKDIVIKGVKFENRGPHLLNYVHRLHSSVNVNVNQDLLTKQKIAGLN